MDNFVTLLIIVVSIFAFRYILYEWKNLKNRKPTEKKKKNSLSESPTHKWGENWEDDHIKEHKHYLKDFKKGKRRHL